jgi:dolichol-phosphate mannosyltransferase
MSSKPRVWVALPAYNEEQAIEAVLRRWAKVLTAEDRPFRMLVVDDGSTDRTPKLLATLAKELPLEVITHVPNQGLGPTIRDALREAAARADDDELIVTMDADNTHPPESFPQMAAQLERDELDVVIASRFVPGARVVGLSGFRQLTTVGARLVFRLLARVPGVRDYTCGYRVYRAAVVHRALEMGGNLGREQSFACMAEVLLEVARAGARFGEAPLELRYDEKGGASKMRVLKTSWRTLVLVMRYRLGLRSGSGSPGSGSATGAPAGSDASSPAAGASRDSTAGGTDGR